MINKSGLLVRLALVIGFAAVAIGFLSTQVFYRLTYLQELDVANQNIANLHKTVQATASTAAYIVGEDLAKEVVDGLSTNDMVKNAAIEFDDIRVTSNISIINDPLMFPIYSPFEPDKIVGQLFIQPDLDFIEGRARDLASENSKAMILQAFVVTLVAMSVAFLLITRPMIQIASSLHSTKPGEGNRLKVPDFHQSSELGELVRDINKLLDKTEHQLSQERELRQEIEALEKRFRMLFENSFSPIVMMEPRGNIILFNNAFETLLGKLNLHLKKSFGPLLEDLFADPEKLHRAVVQAFANEEIATGEFMLRETSDGGSFWVQVVVTSIISEDMREYYQITLHDISKRKKELDALAYQADFDGLTKLHNRQGLEKHIETLINSRHPFALMLFDLNWFKQVNDRYGHESGDEILVYVADKIKKSIRDQDIGGRWGGDEFVLLLSDADEGQVTQIAERLLTRITKPYFLRKYNQNVSVGASMGVAFFPNDSEDMQTIINKADQAMYDIKKSREQDPDAFLKFASGKGRST